ncbi:uncharacterized protein TNCT_88951 [Trichonephila clavata]|uniref:Apple domain-containing protein n=1 Tax=Trichonephila clavata TaxID=2740835 RepID=A0A8X6IJ79_TRICU|nr:uncharacterized protein TNCT_88951 [Trichonephila clavata]
MISLFLLLSIHRVFCGESYTYLLTIRDQLFPDWVTEDLRFVTRTECASLCFKKEACTHFGFLVSQCLLLRDELDGCPDDECPTRTGMKIYEASALMTFVRKHMGSKRELMCGDGKINLKNDQE